MLKTKEKLGWPLKVNPLQLDFEHNKAFKKIHDEIAEARKSRTISFDPPVISFYNKKHPKMARKNHRKSNSSLDPESGAS